MLTDNVPPAILLPLKQIKVPLERGWKRRLVEDPLNGPIIQYVCPEGETFNNKQQISEHLTSTASTLSPDWFIFSAAVILEKEIEYEVDGKSSQVYRTAATDVDIICSRSCPGRGGSRPSLACKECLTYFHPKCLHLNDDNIEFICHSCSKLAASLPPAKRQRLEPPTFTLPDNIIRIILLCMNEVVDLVAASQVCKQWNSLSRAPHLWKTARMIGVKLSYSLDTFKEKFPELTTLDTRGMVGGDWPALGPILSSIPTLKFITLGRVTAGAVMMQLSNIKGIKHLQAQYMVSDDENKRLTEIDLSLCSTQPHLRHFSVCSVDHLTLPTNCDLTALRKLQRLQTLSLTSFTPGVLIKSGLRFISHLRNLSSLQLGSCEDWTDDTFSIFTNLTNLQHLRLETGPLEPSPALGIGLLKLHQLVQLELISFPLHKNLSDNLPQLPKLNLLNLAPHSSSNEALAVMNQLVLTLMRDVNIYAGEWGVVISSNKTAGSNTLIIPIRRVFVADSVVYKVASRRGSGDILMLNISEAKKLLEECVADNGISFVYTLSENTAHWIKMIH